MSTAKDMAKYVLGLYQIATSPIRIMPDFFIIGAQKGGTTSLYYYLVKHPSIASAWRKELSFFDSNFQKGLSWYRGQFPFNIRKYYAEHVHKQDFITGEASPSYLFYPNVPKRVAEIFPHIKLIVLLRNPVDRAYSLYCHQVARGREKLSFEDAIACEEERTRGDAEKMVTHENCYSYNYEHYSYVARGVYVDQLQRWFRWFPREQFLIHRSEDFYTDPATIYRQTLEFLNILYVEPTKKYAVYNKALYTPPSKMDPKVRKRLIEYFEPHNLRLYELLDRDFSWNS
jgi:hypothetical protein